MSTWSISTCLGRGWGQGGRERDGTGEEGSSLLWERGDLPSGKGEDLQFEKLGDSHFVDEGMFLGGVLLFHVEDQWRSYCFAQLSVLLTSLSPAGGQATLLRTLCNSLLGNTKPKRRAEGTKSSCEFDNNRAFGQHTLYKSWSGKIFRINVDFWQTFK